MSSSDSILSSNYPTPNNINSILNPHHLPNISHHPSIINTQHLVMRQSPNSISLRKAHLMYRSMILNPHHSSLNLIIPLP
ncbi:Protein of unknown function [Pyronema omphalodes CBS 100304]|uniref:Uncharacterized protein n=1 Tax=Pyronema omphalodes (strain CBS 100304) TaxID=1076935 RepID=U4L7H9_PYROM|nr:Protein of unknown function [Pyronema omphalodes CBS 100304]